MLATMKWGHIPLPDDLRKHIYSQVMQFSALNLVIGFALPHVDNMGHLGGLLSGVLAGVVLGKRLDPSRESVAYRLRAWGLLILLLLIGIYGTMRFHARLLHGG
jgi:hypothetical protein